MEYVIPDPPPVNASRSSDPLEPIESRLAVAEAATRYYNRDVHRGAFAVPNQFKKLIEKPR